MVLHRLLRGALASVVAAALALLLGSACVIVEPDPLPPPGPPPDEVWIEEPGPVLSIDVFHRALAPHGTWIRIDAYGYCWQPSVALTVGWHPYLYGHWVYTDQGWMWVSDYIWGWAPFHYGRWVLDPRYGWVWVPDTVWAPAWVSWWVCDGWIGWAPLPIGVVLVVGVVPVIPIDWFIYVPAPRLLDRRLDRVRGAPSEVRALHARARPVLDLGGDGATRFDRGPSADHVRSNGAGEVAARRVRSVDFKGPVDEVEVNREARPLAGEVEVHRPTLRESPGTRIERLPETRPTRPARPEEFERRPLRRDTGRARAPTAPAPAPAPAPRDGRAGGRR